MRDSIKHGHRLCAIAVGLVQRGDELLVFEDHDPVAGETFYRPSGGGIELGELGDQALRRECGEEIGADLVNVQYLTASENLFTCSGATGHENLLLYRADLPSESVGEKDPLLVRDDQSELQGYWMSLDQREGDPIRLNCDDPLPMLREERGF